MLLISGIIIWPTFCSSVIPLTMLSINLELSGRTHSLGLDQSVLAKTETLNNNIERNFFIRDYPRVI